MHPVLLNSNISVGGLYSVSLANNSGALIFYTTQDGTVNYICNSISNYRGVNMTPPATLGKCRQVVTGYSSAAALQTDGTVIGWGEDGNAAKTNAEYFMIQLNQTGKKVVKLAAGAYHYLALLNDGSVVTWGNQNETAQFSDPNTVWTPVGLIPRPTAAEHPYITGYSAYTNWEYKQDAASFLEAVESPTTCVPNPEPIFYRLFRNLAIGCPLHNGENYSSSNPNGGYDTPYIRTSGIYSGTYPKAGANFAWSGILNWLNDTGAPYDYQFSRATVGDSTSVNYSGPGSSWTKSTAHITMPAGCYNNNCSSPNSIFGTSGKKYIDIAAGRGHSILLTEDGNIETWGQNWYYTITGSGKQGNGWSRAGSGMPNGLNDGVNAGWGAAYPFPPAPVGDQTASTVKSFKTTAGSVKAIGTGYYTSQVIKSDGSVFAWDRNEWGESTPLRNSDGTLGLPTGPFKQVAGGYHHTVALRENGSVVCWGENNSGECNVPFGLTNCVQVIAGARYTAALRNDGYLIFWGKVNEFGASYTPVIDATTFRATDLVVHI
jgi:alpha-tubulin suppressor-like RCC1 family protein